MAKVFVISDLHFGHTNMALRRGFKTVEEHDEFIVDKWNSVVTKHDCVYILGDITMEKANYDILDRLKGFKKVVLGNHDKGNHVRKLLEHVNSVSGMIKYKKDVFLTHCPIHPSELEFRVKYNIHGHVHENSIVKIEEEYGDLITVPDNRYINVSCENINYTPVQFQDLINL